VRLDAEVRSRVRAGAIDDAATEAIRGLGAEALRLLRAQLRSEDEVGEAYSRWAENLWQGLPGFGWRSSLRTWARRIARHAALDVRGEAWRRRERPFAVGEAARLPGGPWPSPSDGDERRARALEALRAACSPAERTLLELRVSRRLPWAEVAALLSREGAPLDRAAAMKRYDRLKARLERRARTLGLAG
jgi:RNA polymerase sigma-70 factor (ECF subfamily)